ncbi:MAG: glycosyltransferase [Ignavibacteria bacterium]
MTNSSLIISVYDKSKELELIFYALSIQSFNGFEVIVAEDGMNDNVRQLINIWKQKNLFPIRHITQEDNGFRKNKILNESIKHSHTDYLVFIDGDCIPHSDFMKAHIFNRHSNAVLCGRRVNLTRSITDKLNKNKIMSREYQKIKISEAIYSSLNRHKAEFNFNIEEGFIYKNKTLRNILTNEDEHILGCNFSVEKKLLEKINGFDENYEGPGLGEDSDIEYRLRLTGVKFKSVRNLAVQYHLYHKKTIEEPLNMDYFNKVKMSKEYFCRNGLLKLYN